MTKASVEHDLTPAKLRYLLVIAQIAEETHGQVRCIDIAIRLGVARASVCRMLTAFVREGLLVQEGGRSGVKLTEKGQATAQRYTQRCAQLRTAFAQRFALSDFDAQECAVTLMASLPGSTLDALTASAAANS